MIIQTEVQDFIGDQKNSVTRSLLAQAFEESRAGRDHADSEWHRIHQQGRQIVLILLDQVAAGLRPIPWQHQHITSHALGSTGFGDGSGRVRFAPTLGSWTLADLRIVLDAVIGAFEFRDLAPACIGSRCLDSQHHCLGAGVTEADLFHIRDARGE